MERLKPTITQAQCEAWELEHEAILAPDLAKGYYRAAAHDIREAERLEHKRQIYQHGDDQNELLDAIEEIRNRGQEIVITTAKELAHSGSR